MADTDVRKSDTGTKFILTILDDGAPVDLSSATDLKVKFRKKDKTTAIIEAELENNGTDGVITFTSGSGDFDQVGDWNMQVYIQMPDGHWHSNVHKFSVGEVIA